jgi:transposase-like protein
MARDYKKEYENYHSSSKQKKRRAARNKARRKMIRDGRARKGDGKDVHHRDGNPRNNSKSNLSVTSKRRNRSFKRNKNAGKA